jgi:hypothetical protein
VRNAPPSGAISDDYVSFLCIVSFILFIISFIFITRASVSFEILVLVLYFNYPCVVLYIEKNCNERFKKMLASKNKSFVL